MSRLVSVFSRREGAATQPPLRQITLDDLWAQAEAIGKIKVDHPFLKDDYSVSLTIDLPSGSTLWARATGRTIHDALANAINEAGRICEGVRGPR